MAEEGSEMSLCLGKRFSLGAGRWPPNPRTHALCQGKRTWAGQQIRTRDQQLNLSLTVSELESIRSGAPRRSACARFISAALCCSTRITPIRNAARA